LAERLSQGRTAGRNLKSLHLEKPKPQPDGKKDLAIEEKSLIFFGCASGDGSCN